MIGSNLHEGTMFVRPEQTNFPNSWDMVKEMFVKRTTTRRALRGSRIIMKREK